MGGRRRSVLVAALAIFAIALAGAGAARAENIELPNWPRLLPPWPKDASDTLNIGFDTCPSGSLACPPRVIDEMQERWRPLDASCDHRAVFALTYLRTTQEFFRTVKSRRGFFDDRRWVDHEDAVFAKLYFHAYDRYVNGRRVPAAWKTAFDAAQSPNVTGIGDLLLGMNAHIDRDLPYALAHVGLVKPNGRSHKHDHNRVNKFLSRVIDPLQVELARRYDPIFKATDAEPSPLDEVGALQAVRTMRENAWRNAERLVNADSKAERREVQESIEAESEAGAQVILAANTVPGYGESRDAYCESR